MLNPRASSTVPLGTEAMKGATRDTTCSTDKGVSKAEEKALMPKMLLTKLD